MKPLSREVNGTRNRILGHLPSKDFQRLRQRMKLVELPLGTSLYEPYAPLKRVYFPEDGLASLKSCFEIVHDKQNVGRRW